jgi:hypothetical protein
MSTICLGMSLGLPHLEMAGWGCIYSPQHKCSRWRKAAALCGTTDSPVVHRTVRWCIGQSGGASDSPVAHRTMHCSLSGVPSCYPDTAGDRWRRRLFTPDSPMLFPPQCHLELAIGLRFPGAPDSPVCHRIVRCSSHRQSAGNTHLHFLDFSLIFLMSSFEVLISSIP